MSLYASVCNNTVAMWPLCIGLIVSFWRKNNRENFCNTGKTQGKHREFHFGLNVATLNKSYWFHFNYSIQFVQSQFPKPIGFEAAEVQLHGCLET